MGTYPIIGISMYLAPDRELSPGTRLRGLEGQDLVLSTTDYAHGIEQAGGIPFLIPPVLGNDTIEGVVASLDGVLLTGGEDISPMHYGRPAEAGIGRRVPERDEFELKLLRTALARKKPVLAICRGMQLVNVFFGGTLVQDISHAPGSIDHQGLATASKWAPSHRIQVHAGSALAGIFSNPETPLWVNSFHHQAVDHIGEGLNVTAHSEDGLIEAMESKDGSVLTLQWHPEMMFGHMPTQIAPFRWLVERAEPQRTRTER